MISKRIKSIYQYRALLNETNIFFERSEGRYYLGENLRLNVKRAYHSREYQAIAFWQMYIPQPYLSERKRRRTDYIPQVKWWRVDLEFVLANADKEQSRKILYHLDILPQ